MYSFKLSALTSFNICETRQFAGLFSVIIDTG